jgi:hypothetical protein
MYFSASDGGFRTRILPNPIVIKGEVFTFSDLPIPSTPGFTYRTAASEIWDGQKVNWWTYAETGEWLPAPFHIDVTIYQLVSNMVDELTSDNTDSSHYPSTIALSNVANLLNQAISGKADQASLNAHINNQTVHITTDERNKLATAPSDIGQTLNGKVDKTNAANAIYGTDETGDQMIFGFERGADNDDTVASVSYVNSKEMTLGMGSMQINSNVNNQNITGYPVILAVNSRGSNQQGTTVLEIAPNTQYGNIFLSQAGANVSITYLVPSGWFYRVSRDVPDSIIWAYWTALSIE